MFVVSKRNIILPGPDGKKFHMPNKAHSGLLLCSGCVELGEIFLKHLRRVASSAAANVGATLGDSSVTYDTAALTRATEGWGDLNATQYGQMLATRAPRAGMGGTYVI